MTTGESLTLGGCAPTPLASYLKAIGVLRLLSRGANHVGGRAADPDARGRWENERFHLTTRLSREDLRRFFLEKYAPSPIIAPWNGRAGFLEGDAGESSSRTGAELMKVIEESKSRRLKNIRQTIRSLRENKDLHECNFLRARIKVLSKELKYISGAEKEQKNVRKKELDKKLKKIKSQLLANLRSTTDAEHLSYIDACYVLSTDDFAAPLLVSGGNDGSRDFGVNFAEKLRDLFEFDVGAPTDRGCAEIATALFDASERIDGSGSIGHFSPGLGGPNATTGYRGDKPQNSWDLVLTMEGAIVFAGALTRRWGAKGGGRAAFPFTFEPSRAGAGNFATEDPNRPRGEIWIPLWTKPATFSEISAIFSEGRLTVGQRAARTGLDAARSVARIGLSRGIDRFERYSIYQPDTKLPFQATPLGRIRVSSRPRPDLIEDLEADDWLAKARDSISSKKKAPARARAAMRRLEDALFQMTDAGQTREGIRNTFMALGEIVNWTASDSNIQEALRPPPAMSSQWIRLADDGSPEFRIAAALAALGVPPFDRRDDGEIEAASGTRDEKEGSTGALETPRSPPPMAAHFASIDEGCFLESQRRGGRRAWSKDTKLKNNRQIPPTVVWGAGGLVANMIAVLERRLVEGAIRGLEDKPLAGALPASLVDIGAFLSGAFDDARCAALLAGMVWVRPYRPRARAAASAASAPFAYAALKPTFAPDDALRRIGALPETARLPVPSGLVARLRAGGGDRDGRATDAAARAALTRARASGLVSPFESYRAETGHIGAGLRADRLAAALLVPIDDDELKTLVEHAFPGIFTEDSVESAEDADNDA